MMTKGVGQHGNLVVATSHVYLVNTSANFRGYYWFSSPDKASGKDIYTVLLVGQFPQCQVESSYHFHCVQLYTNKERGGWMSEPTYT